MSKPRIDAKDALADIRAGMDDAALMKKYNISAKGLHSLLKKLSDAGMLQQSELESRLSEAEESILIDYSGISLQDADRAPVPQPEPSKESTCVLAVSEDEQLLTMVERMPPIDGLTITPYENGLPDPELLGELQPELVLADIDSSCADYMDVIRRTREFDDSVPVILIAGAGRREEALLGIEAGAYDFLEKPLDERLLGITIRRVREYRSLSLFRKDQARMADKAVADHTSSLTDTQDFLNGILKSSPMVSVILTDRDQNVRFWNKGAENIFGYSAQEMIGNKITKIYPPDMLTKEAVAELRALMENRQGTVQAKMKQVSKDGRVLTIALAISPMLSQSGDVEGILGVGLDVTQEVHQNKEIVKLLQKVKQSQELALVALARLMEARQGTSTGHLNRVQEYCRKLSQGLAKRPEFQEMITQTFTDDLIRSSVLYDVGNVALPDRILLHPGTYSPEEREVMKQHPLIGGKAFQEAVRKIGAESFLSTGMEVAFYHHERWDGNGYPIGLKREEIPLSARIVAIADVYDALTSERPYRKAFSHEEACSIILQGKGTDFDPVLVDEFRELQSEFHMIRQVFGD